MDAACKKAKEEGEQWTSVSSSSAITNLPSHILMEILFRLPIKTLVATKSVCKSWLHLIKDPHFCKLHQARAKVELCFQSYIGENTTKLYLGSSNFMKYSHYLDIKLITLAHLPKIRVRSEKVLCYFANSCNGLLCYSTTPGSKFTFAVIWNPVTSEFITFPSHKGLSTVNIACWLGFSQKANRFKLLRAMFRDARVVTEIFTIEKGSSWKSLGSCPTFWDPYRPSGQWLGIFLQGALHWLCARSHKLDIVSFNFEDEKFRKVPLPSHLKKTNNYPNGGKIGVMSGCLYITDNTGEGVDIWLMKKYGVRDSWTKVFSLQFTTMDERMKYGCCIPIKYIENGEILMRSTNRSCTYIFLYNPFLKSIRVIGSFSALLRHVIEYSPSLVRLKDSMMPYDVHVGPRCADLKPEVLSPSWWKPAVDAKHIAREEELLAEVETLKQQVEQARLQRDEWKNKALAALETQHRGFSHYKLAFNHYTDPSMLFIKKDEFT